MFGTSMTPQNLAITSIHPPNSQDMVRIFKVIGGIVKTFKVIGE